jgi:hypothetical protein
VIMRKEVFLGLIQEASDNDGQKEAALEILAESDLILIEVLCKIAADHPETASKYFDELVEPLNDHTQSGYDPIGGGGGSARSDLPYGQGGGGD